MTSVGKPSPDDQYKLIQDALIQQKRVVYNKTTKQFEVKTRSEAKNLSASEYITDLNGIKEKITEYISENGIKDAKSLIKAFETRANSLNNRFVLWGTSQRKKAVEQLKKIETEVQGTVALKSGRLKEQIKIQNNLVTNLNVLNNIIDDPYFKNLLSEQGLSEETFDKLFSHFKEAKKGAATYLAGLNVVATMVEQKNPKALQSYELLVNQEYNKYIESQKKAAKSVLLATDPFIKAKLLVVEEKYRDKRDFLPIDKTLEELMTSVIQNPPRAELLAQEISPAALATIRTVNQQFNDSL